jgi:deoxycytidine triphosphate deaminase
MEAGLIKVTPDPVKVGPNSIDLRLGDTLKQYHPTAGRVTVRDPMSGETFFAIDPKNPPPLIDVPKVDKDGYRDCWLLVPGQFYLGVTLEETYCRGVVPHLDGRSTCGRLSIEAHKTAGVGDNGFRGRWTLEIEATEPVFLRPGDRLFQVYFTPCWGLELAHLIRSIADGTPIRFLQSGPDQDTNIGRLLELDDLYGKGGEHHYQGSEEVRGPSPLD